MHREESRQAKKHRMLTTAHSELQSSKGTAVFRLLDDQRVIWNREAETWLEQTVGTSAQSLETEAVLNVRSRGSKESDRDMNIGRCHCRTLSEASPKTNRARYMPRYP